MTARFLGMGIGSTVCGCDMRPRSKQTGPAIGLTAIERVGRWYYLTCLDCLATWRGNLRMPADGTDGAKGDGR